MTILTFILFIEGVRYMTKSSEVWDTYSIYHLFYICSLLQFLFSSEVFTFTFEINFIIVLYNEDFGNCKPF